MSLFETIKRLSRSVPRWPGTSPAPSSTTPFLHPFDAFSPQLRPTSIFVWDCIPTAQSGCSLSYGRRCRKKVKASHPSIFGEGEEKEEGSGDRRKERGGSVTTSQSKINESRSTHICNFPYIHSSTVKYVTIRGTAMMSSKNVVDQCRLPDHFRPLSSR